MSMQVVIAGGSGFLGRALTSALLRAGHTVTVLGRGPEPTATSGGRVAHVAWTPNGSATGAWPQIVDGVDVVVNLAGAGIADSRWTRARKGVIESSRLSSTKSLVAAVQRASTPPKVFIQGSAVGYYGASLDAQPHDESSLPAADFLGDLSRRWEEAAAPVAETGSRLALVRTGVVLDALDGALPKMALPFKLFGGGPVGSGRQVLSWIHRDDWTKLMLWLMERKDATGPFNACAPEAVSNREFSRALGRALRRPSWLPVPAPALRALFGEMGDAILLKGQHAVPTRAIAMGFRFDYPTIDSALGDIY